jgi:hypothetical protein
VRTRHAAAVDAATGYAPFTPRAAAPGDTVHVTLDSYNCDGWDADTIGLRLTRDVGGPTRQTQMHRAGQAGQFTFVVPTLPAGRYWASVECAPGDWLEVSANGGDGAPGNPRFTVRPAAPDTATAPVVEPGRRSSLGGGAIATIVVVRLLSAALVVRRTTQRDA